MAGVITVQAKYPPCRESDTVLLSSFASSIRCLGVDGAPDSCRNLNLPIGPEPVQNECVEVWSDFVLSCKEWNLGLPSSVFPLGGERSSRGGRKDIPAATYETIMDSETLGVVGTPLQLGDKIRFPAAHYLIKWAAIILLGDGEAGSKGSQSTDGANRSLSCDPDWRGRSLAESEREMDWVDPKINDPRQGDLE
ncbi:hypothetical protein TNCV_126731 [Trichonephila clavipes]|nr:hypothetical protein TNCV_126731 [Trichonephila clavipes]